MKNYYLLSVLFFYSLLSYAEIDSIQFQRSHIDSLQNEVRFHEENPNYLSNLLRLSGLYLNANLDSSIYYADKAISFATKLNDITVLERAYRAKGVAYYYKAEYSDALRFYFEALNISEKEENPNTVNSTVQNIGKIYEVQQEYDKALEYYSRGLELLNDTSSPKLTALAYSNMANILNYKEEYVKALSYHEKAIKIRQKEDNTFLPYSYNDIAIVYRNLGNLGEAIKAYKLSYSSLKALNEKRGLAGVSNNISSLYLELGKVDSALKYAKQSYKLAYQVHAKHELMGASFQLSELYERKGNYREALKYERQSNELYDSLFTQEKMREVATLETQVKFNDERAKSQLLREQQKAKMDQQVVLTIAAIIVCFLLIGVIMIFMKERSKQNILNKKLVEANKLLQEQQEELAKKNKEGKEHNDRLNTLNEEKNHLIGVVAHDLRNPLTSALSLSQLLNEELDGDNQECIQGVSNALNRMHEMITRILDVKAIEAGHLNLMQSEFELDIIVECVVESCKHSAAEKGISVHQKLKPVQVYADPHCVKQVLDNLLSNAIKFSPKTKNIFVEIDQVDNEVKVSIADEGPGISTEDQEKMFGKFQRLSAKPTNGESSTGLGLSIAKKFMDVMNGKLECKSTLGKGSTFTAVLPLKVPQETSVID
ncbi:ATP-binding protein [Flammeovirga kamogawensis]|uniref:histidine kinase n=1 Tax=Flammeovirga kamogawensis TaxID=373891 RepID=A0ABX8GZ28_9BACT|nr:ATP-binding protein [Flammeovirga kamogawensis]MBB6462856.1 signal transduction histidine kinase [Flammeovirga kamogawensis]QWG08362.1 tetratricopeptide repeat protein [Flammeovirga kamogawensis]TRX66658.1 tetratricopeptide repeat protein [Flammeovirga kamogawensis]